jgi:hypothetical protein
MVHREFKAEIARDADPGASTILHILHVLGSIRVAVDS